jgi:hypothetical protein
MTPAPPALAVQPRRPTRTNRLRRLIAAASVAALIAGVGAITIRQQDRGATAISLANTEPMGGSNQPTTDPVLTPTLS